jgi:hypothetical protein
LDNVKDEFGSLFNEHVVVLQVEEFDHLLLVVFVLTNPISKLCRSLVLLKTIVSPVCCNTCALLDDCVLLQSFKNGSSSCANRIHHEPELEFIFVVVFNLLLVSDFVKHFPVRMVLREVENIIIRRIKCLVKHKLRLIEHNNIYREFSTQTERNHHTELLPITIDFIEVLANFFEYVDHLLQRDASCIYIY